MSKNSKKKKSVLKRVFSIIIVTIIVLIGVTTVTYKTVPQVKEQVDKTVIKITGPLTNNPFFNFPFVKLEKLPSVQNIYYDEANGILTFDEVENADIYEITIDNLTNGKGGMIQSSTSTLDLYFPNDYRTGDEILFTVVAKGDKQKYENSNGTTYTHTVLYADARMNVKANKLFLNDVIYNVLKYNGKMKVNEPIINAMYIDDNHFYFEGTGISNDKRPLNYKIEFNLSKYADKLPTDFTNPKSFSELSAIIKNDKFSDMIITVEYADSYHNLQDVLDEDVIKYFLEPGKKDSFFEKEAFRRDVFIEKVEAEEVIYD